MSSLDRFQFLTTNLLTGQVLSIVELSSIYWDEIYNQPGSALATARFDLPTTIPENFPDWAGALWVLEDGTPIWGGIIGKTQPRGGTRVLSIPVIGFFEYYRNRFLRSAAGMAYGTSDTGELIVWDEIDQFRIFKDCIDHVHTFTDGDIGVGVSWDALSGILLTSKWRKSTVKRVGPLLEEQMAGVDGYEYRQVYSVSNDIPQVSFKLEYPILSNTLDEPLRFQPEYTVDEVQTVQRALDVGGSSGDYASAGDVTAITGDIDITVKYWPSTWTPAAIETLRSKWGSAGNRSFRFQLLTTGHLRFEWTTDGTNINQEDSDYAVSIANGNPGTVRITIDVDNGDGNYRVEFYESEDDGITWSALNDPADDLYASTYSVLY